MREGVNMVALCLFEHNEKAYRAAVRMMEQYGKAAIVHPTGTGKSYIAFKLIEDNPEKVVIWLSPSEYIFKTQLESLKRNDPYFPLANVHFYTYAKLMFCTQAQLDEIAAQKPAYIILYEFHRAGAECWGESTVALLKLCPDAKLLGLTATNIRYLDNNRDMAEELFDSRVASDMTLGEAVVRGILPAPKYVTTVYQYQKTLAKYQARVDNLRAPGIQDVNQKYLDALRRALEQADGLDRVFAHHITNKAGKYIVFCANKEHMDEMVSHVPEWFAGVNPDVVVYEAYSDDPNTDKAFSDFKTDTSNRLKLLFCIDMLNEGVHVEGISGVILFRPTISPIIYKQQIGRALTAGDNTTPLILDVVNNFEGLTSISGRHFCGCIFKIRIRSLHFCNFPRTFQEHHVSSGSESICHRNVTCIPSGDCTCLIQFSQCLNCFYSLRTIDIPGCFGFIFICNGTTHAPNERAEIPTSQCRLIISPYLLTVCIGSC